MAAGVMARHLATVAGVAAGVAAAVAVGVAGHSSLTLPTPFSYDVFCKTESAQNCPGPCPVRDLKASPPVQTWARGQTVPLRWFRNNHEGGFVRWALVTPDKVNDQAAHNAGAFAYGCYSVGRYTCTAAEKATHCGADNTGSGHRIEAQVPTHLPDGEYVLGWVWYGGFNHPNIEFSDYVDCARVRIAGGVPQTSSYQPVLLPGSDAAPEGSCEATRNSISQCRNDRCPGRPVSVMVPAEFAGGAKPPPIPASLYGGGGGKHAWLSVPQGRSGDAPVAVPTPTPTPTPPPKATPPPPPPPPPAASSGGDGILVSLDVIRVSDQSRIGTFPISDDGRAAGTVEVGLPDGGVNVEAVTTGDVTWAQFRIDGSVARHEQYRPYLLGPGVAGDARAWKGAARGRTYAITVAVKTLEGAMVYGSWSVKFV